MIYKNLFWKDRGKKNEAEAVWCSSSNPYCPNVSTTPIRAIRCLQCCLLIVTDRRGVLPFCPYRTEQVNQSSVSRTETEQNRTCKKVHKNLELNCKQRRNNFKLIRCEA